MGHGRRPDRRWDDNDDRTLGGLPQDEASVTERTPPPHDSRMGTGPTEAEDASSGWAPGGMPPDSSAPDSSGGADEPGSEGNEGTTKP